MIQISYSLSFKMNENLLQHSGEGDPSYDPFKSPPDLKLAEVHRQATMVGSFDAKEKPRFCPCCDHIVNKTPLPVAFKDDDLLNLGVGYPLYYKISKYFILILLGIFFISGSAMYFLMTLRCDADTCWSIFGIPIINISITQEHNISKAQLVNTATAIIIFIIVLYLKTVTNQDIKTLTTKKNCPSLYTIMLQNVPNVSDEELSEWIQERFGNKPVAISWAYDVQELSKAYKRKHETLIEINKIKLKLEHHLKIDQEHPDNRALGDLKKGEKNESDLKKQLERLNALVSKYDQILEKYNVQDKECEKIGTAFVSFQKVETVYSIIDEYECSFFNSFFKTLFVWVKKSRLCYKDRYSGKYLRIIVVNKAPAPKEVIWQNLRFSYIRSLIFQLVFIVVMALMLGGALRVILLFMNYSLSFRIEGEKTGQFWIVVKGIIISLLVVVINCLMRLVIQAFTYAKRYYSYTKYQGSFILYYSIFYIINACCIVYIVHEKDAQENKQLLLTDIHLVMLANAFSEPLFKLFDPVMWFRTFRRCYISRLKPEENPYTQQYVNRAWQGHQISNADNYQYITRVLFITTWFATVAPMGVFLSLLAIALDYWISKWLLVRYYKIPENVSQDIAKPTLMGLQLLPLVYILGVLQFNYKISTTENLVDFFVDFLNYGVTTLLLLLSITGYIIFCKKPVMPQVQRGYTQAKLGFRYSYDSTNPITKLKGDIDFLYEILKQNANAQECDRITNLLKLSRISPLKLSDHRQELFLLKMSMEKKLSAVKPEIELSEKRASQV